jgi:hypothetical protein
MSPATANTLPSVRSASAWAPFGHGVALCPRLSESCGRPLRTRGPPMSAQPLPALGSGDPSAWGQGPLCLPRREGQPLRLPPHRRVVLADALALLRRPRQDARQGEAGRRTGLGPRHRQVGPDALRHNGRRPDRLPVELLPLPDPDGPGRRKPLRRGRAPQERPVGSPWVRRRRRSCGRRQQGCS